MRSQLLALVFAGIAAAAASAQPVVLYDPARTGPSSPPSAADEDLAKTRLVPKAAAQWSDDEECSGGNLNVVGAVNGSFTRRGASQRAIVYELCQTGNGLANNGIAVVENGAVAAHFVYPGGWNLDVLRVADIDRNGFDELVIETGGGMHQGYTGSSITLVEVSPSRVRELASFLAYTNECEAYVEDKFCDRSFKLTATPGNPPAFTSQKFTNRGSDQKPRWVAAGRAVPAAKVGEPYEYTRLQ